MAIEWTREHAAHLLRRTTFGPSAKEIDKAFKKGLEATLADLLKERPTRDGYPRRINETPDLQAWWLRRMLRRKGALIEHMVLLWHDHFATSIVKVDDLFLMHQQNRLMRRRALAPFRDLVLEMTRDPAMLIWLDNESNVAANPNENFARELMELFTTGTHDKFGAPTYTERDVEAGARAFTGWTQFDDEFFFDAENHDFGQKTFRGITGDLDGDDVIENLVTDPATARRVAWRIHSHFAHDVDLDDPLLDPLESAYLQNDTSIRAVVETLLRSDAFYSERAKGARIPWPAELVASTVRRLGAGVRARRAFQLADWSTQLGQALFAPPSVFGWKKGAAWVGSQGLLARAEFAARATGSRYPGDVLRFNPLALVGGRRKARKLDAAGLVDALLERLGPVALGADTRAALIAYVETDPSGNRTGFDPDRDTLDSKVRGVAALVLASPESQVV